ncbi:MAG: PilZ domain-containing protein [Nitrospira sp.]|nr:PilZ domain-containing protein [Nitrospira sp.]MBH0205528.1 PilZ domain-containing protein [Nitrospira sp.]
MAISRAKRWKVQYPVQVFTDGLFVEGRTVDISLEGLRVATESAIRQGACVVVRVLVPDGEYPVDCALYTVRWIDQGRIGLEASEISVTEQKRLQDRLASLDQHQEPVAESAIPCMPTEQPITSITGTVAGLWQLIFPGHHVINTPNRGLHSLQRSKH